MDFPFLRLCEFSKPGFCEFSVGEKRIEFAEFTKGITEHRITFPAFIDCRMPWYLYKMVTQNMLRTHGGK